MIDRLISEQTIIDVLSKGYWDKNLQSAKDDPCVIDAMIDWAIRQIKAIPSAEEAEKRWKETIENIVSEKIRKLVQIDFTCPYCGKKYTIKELGKWEEGDAE